VAERTADDVPGAAREVGPSLYDQLRADPTPPPAALLEESYEFLGDADLPFSSYTSERFARAERDLMWPRTWQWACHVDHLPEAGDYVVYDVGDHSALVVRTEHGEIRAFHNACMHRGTQLKPPGSCGFSRTLRCPFHGWEWDLDGELTELPCQWDFPHAGPNTHGLARISVGVWEGFVFVNFDPDAEPLADYLGVMTRHWADWGLADRYIETHVRKRLPCNWKAAVEAFLEAYHVRETHATGRLGDEVTAAYDVFAPNVSRFIHTIALDSPLRPVPRTEAEILASSLGRRNADAVEIPDGVRARDLIARAVQESAGAASGRDVTSLSQSMTIDSIQYFVFPNGFFFPGLQLPMVYRFRPDPASIDHSYFELLMMRQRPADRPAPPPPPVIELDIDDSYSLAEGLGALGRVYDQDTANLAAQTRGFRASAKRGQTLGNYQEVRTRHFQQRVRDFVGVPDIATPEARIAIHDALTSYCHGIDRLDRAALLAAFHPGAELIDYAPVPITIETFADGVLTALRTSYTATQHRIGNVRIDFDISGALVETYVQASHVEATGDGERLHTFTGRYVDRFTEVHGAWRIARRTLRVDWSKVEPIEERMRGSFRASGRDGTPDPLDERP
jgi:nitrite reductase/ring-hydroxylating ferredoxin subunit